MGIGLSATEARVLDTSQTGKMVNRNGYDYKVPTILDVPDRMISLPIETNDAEVNTTGAKGLGRAGHDSDSSRRGQRRLPRYWHTRHTNTDQPGSSMPAAGRAQKGGLT